ncbi:unnamed protein product [Candidula unifasciata]|uniref:xanthine dehydrogenase n=1 Tax=Candidula unifasciata TaxID=100452 RepID=A0A8S4A227_9EUPU|nr:unnamed protein product [Candidula unifasciata]
MSQDSNETKGDTLVFYVNGVKVTESKPDPEMTLLTYIRTKLHLTGAKLGCGEGGCGACTVMVSRYLPAIDVVRHYSVNACLAPLCSMQGLAVTTVEGIGNMKNIHPVQERIAKFHGSQCGFCTPGIVMSMYTLLRNNPTPTDTEMEAYFDGNLCRCTGYRPILDGFRTFTKEFKCALGEQCCQKRSTATNHSSSNTVLGPKITSLKPYDPTQEPIFPPDLKVNYWKFHGSSHTFIGPNVMWIQPSTLTELVELKARYPSAKLVAGNTEIGVETKFKNMNYPVLISTTNVPELQSVSVSEDGVTIGGAVTLSQFNDELKKVILSFPEHKTRVISSIVEMLQWFAGHQIRNVASVSGNIMTASPISDLNPLFLAAEATVCVQSQERGRRLVKIDKSFFCGYRKTAVASDEVLLSVIIPFTRKNEYFAGYKQANRKEDDISLVTAGMKVAVSKVNTINKVILAFGGMGVTTLLANTTMESIVGDEWTDPLVAKVSELLAGDLPLSPGAPGGFVEFRQALALSFFFKFFVTVRQQILKDEVVKDLSAIQSMEKPACKSMQVVGGMDARLRTHDVVGKPIVHSSALQQSTGEAVYLDDMLPVEGELHMALVTSTHPYADILSIDPSRALSTPGAVDFVSATDVPGVNSLGIYMDTVFATKEVTCQGQVIGAIVAQTQALARSAARLVDIQYEDKQPVVITIEDAIRHESYYKPFRKIQTGNLEAGFSSSQYILEGEAYVGGQNHFYMETMSTRVLPGENGELEVFASTQNPSSFQIDLARVLGIPSSKIVVRVKRLGGGFGGKESQIVLSGIPAAVAASKLRRPVRCVLDRDVDMITTGNRHPFLGRYKAGALVHIYRDGYVLVAHSGTEMGQGLNVKVAQIASEVLEIPLSLIHISETATNAVPNTSPTAASVGTDVNGMAVKNACEVLKERLKPYFQKMPNAQWEEVVHAAYMDSVSLSTTGFYATPNVGYDMDTQTGRPYAYYTFGTACTEVQIDCLTGDHKLLRTDIVMDVGNSVNPAIDVGQIEGAFAQGYGLHLLEDVKVTPDGSHLTRGPGNYKIPAFGNIPAEFNVHLVPDSPNPNAIFASRAVGEPPLLLASSALFAVKEAIRAARQDTGASIKFQLNSPALPADIRMACQDDFAKKFPRIDPKTYKPWAVTL